MALEIISFSLQMLDLSFHACVKLQDNYQAYKLNDETVKGIKARVVSIRQHLQKHEEEVTHGRQTPGRAPVWEEALRSHQEDFSEIKNETTELEKALLEKGKVKLFLTASKTSRRMEGVLENVTKLQNNLQLKGFFMATRDETKGYIDFRVGAATDEIKAFLSQMLTPALQAREASLPASSSDAVVTEGRAGLVLPAVPAAPVNAESPISPAALYGGLGDMLDAPMEGGWKGFAQKFAESAAERQKIEAGTLSSDVAAMNTGALPKAAPVRPAPVRGGSEATEEEEAMELSKLEAKMTRFLFKLSESSLSDEEKTMTAKLVDTLWGMWRVDVEDVERLKDDEGQYMEIGDGSYGRVYKGTKKLRDEEGVVMRDVPVAIKILHKEQSRASDKMKFLREVLLLREAAHENVVSFMGAHWPEGLVDSGPSLGTRAFLVTELMTGSLEDAMADGVFSSFDVVLRALVGITSALAHLHSKRVLHQDIKGENILVNVVDGELQSVKMSDFGVSRMLRRTATRTRRGGTLAGAGTMPYMAPEAILSSGTASFAVDVWSLGLLMAYIGLKEAPPTTKMSDAAMAKAAGDRSLGSLLTQWIGKLGSKTLAKICRACIDPDPQRRPSALEVKSQLLSLAQNGEMTAEQEAASAAASSAADKQAREEAAKYYYTGCQLYFPDGQYEQNVEDAVKWFTEAAKRGHVDAKAHLGFCFVEGIGVLADIQRGLKILYEALQEGSGEAHTTVGHCFQFGVGYTKDEKRAVLHYQFGASANVASAMTNLGFCLLEGCGIEKNAGKAFALFREAAKRQHPVALAHLALCHQFGLGVPANRGEAERVYRVGISAVEQPHGRPPTYCCSAQYNDMASPPAVMRTYRVPPSMFHAPAQIRLAAWFCLPSGNYAEFCELAQKAIDANDPIGIVYQSSVASMRGVAALSSGGTGGVASSLAGLSSAFSGSLSSAFTGAAPSPADNDDSNDTSISKVVARKAAKSGAKMLRRYM